jgi:hypothetical protein
MGSQRQRWREQDKARLNGSGSRQVGLGRMRGFDLDPVHDTARRPIEGIATVHGGAT